MSPGLVLDFDGTVLDTEEPVFRSWSELWADHGVDLDLAGWQSIIGTAGGFDPWAALVERVGPIDEALVEARRARRDELLLAIGLRAGIVAWLDGAAALGVPVAIASSSPLEWVEGHLGRLAIRDRFGPVVCCDDGVPPKPDPTSYRLACERMGADPAASVAVEDSPNGAVAARAAGLYVVVVPHPLTAELDLSAADVVLTDLADLPLADALAAAAARPAG